MNSSCHPNKNLPLPHRRSRHRGFTLIITISLLMLLIMVAMGILSLASISLRQSSQGQAAAEARANARLALMMAIGDLQKTMGPDQAVTASSQLLAPDSSRALTGVWRSWAPKPDDAAPDYQGMKASRFVQWLVSTPVPGRQSSTGTALVAPAQALTLSRAINSGDTPLVADRVMVQQGGAYAWHISDESQKARIDLIRHPSPAAGLAEQRALVAGHRPSFKQITGADSFRFSDLPGDMTVGQYDQSRQTLTKMTSLEQAELLGGEIPPNLRNDITTHSLGVLCDVREGGLKRDLSSAFSMAGGLPPELANQRLYQSTHGIGGVSDPYWSMLSDYHNLFTRYNRNTVPSYNVQRPEAVRVDRHIVPQRYVAAPVIQKFDMMLSVVARDYHGPHVANLNRIDPQRKYMVHLVLLPIFTLHNPYNSEIVFERMNVVIGDMPVGVNFYINGQAQNNRFVPLNDLWIGTGANDGRGTKAMRYDLANWQYPGETSPSSPIRMSPGQTLIFAPYMDPAAGSAQTLRGNWGTREELVTAQNRALKLRPGFSGKAVGLSYDFLAPHAFRSPSAAAASAAPPSNGAVALRWNDRFHMETSIIRPEIGVQTEWDISARIVVDGREVETGGLRFVYNDQQTLQRYFNEIWRYPAQGSIPTDEFYEPYTKPLKDQSRSKVVAMFSTSARTANGGVYEHNRREPIGGALNVRRDGRLTGKPFLHHNPARHAVLVDLSKDAIGHHSHEMNFQSLKGETDDVLEIDGFNRGPALTGNTTARGIKSGALFELPQGPLQTIADFRRSNALISTYLPNPVQPMANSWVPPQMDTASTRENGIATYALLDHSYLSNHALYDGYYFSTLAPRGNSSARDEFVSFFEGRRPLLNQAYQPWRPSGGNSNTFYTSAAPSAKTWREASSWQMVRGAFNVNSTSVLAWKAMLSSLVDTPIPIHWAKSLGLETVVSSGAPVPSFHMPLAGPAEAVAPNLRKIDSKRANEWNGFRSLDPYEMDMLARRIVDEVRTRGPFLSMSEFVNRRLGYNSELTRMGALQSAIDKARLNDSVFNDLFPVRAGDVADMKVYGYRTPEVSYGNPAEGAPGTVSQGDLLHILEPRATVRGDTFFIRTVGQALDASGKVLATAHLEAVVQRVPDFLDPRDAASQSLSQLTSVNAAFGRRFQIVSQRWLHPQEI